MQGFFRLDNTFEIAQPAVEHNIAQPNPNIPDSNFGSHRKPRGRGQRKDKPWEQQTSQFRMVTAPPSQHPTHEILVHDTIQITPPPLAASYHQGLPTPSTPSNASLNEQYHLLFSSPEMQRNAPMSPTSPTVTKSKITRQDQSLLQDPFYALTSSSTIGSADSLQAAASLLRLSRLNSTPDPSAEAISGESSTLFGGPSATEHTPDPPLSPLRDTDITVESRNPSPPPSEIPRTRKKKVKTVDTIHKVIKLLQGSKISLLTFLKTVLDEDCNEFAYSRVAFYAGRKSQFTELLELFWESDKGSPLMKEWLQPHAIELVCDIIHTEMETAKPALQMTMADVTPEFISTWDINSIMEAIAEENTPVWTEILDAATESKESKAKVKTARSRNRRTGRSIISAQVAYLRSFSSCKIQIGLGLMAWSTGASRQLMNVLNQSCWTPAYGSIMKIIEALASRSIEDARQLAAGPHSLAYDNINISSSIFVEQTPSAMSKVQSGTFGVIYELFNASPEHMRLAPMMKRLKESKPLTMASLRPSIAARTSYHSQTMVNVAKILMKYTSGFDKYQTHPILQNHPRRQLPKDLKTKFFPTRASTIEEASVKGNLLVHEDIYVVQLQCNPEHLNEFAVPSYHDQLTNARNRGAQLLRSKDITAWTRRELFQLAFGVFHLIMNLIWCLLHIHRGTINQSGSLTHLFTILDKVRLGAEHPDYHTLLTALTQVLEGLILNAWRKECGFSNLEEFLKSNPSPEQILEIAHTIIKKYATPDESMPPTEKPKKPRKASNTDIPAEQDSDSSDGSESDLDNDAATPQSGDTINENIVRLTRDLLYVMELVHAVSDGDFGRIEDILPDLACIFRGAGSNNYSTEILHLLFNLKEVWTPEFGNIMRDNILVNVSGLSGHFMGIDLNIEHLIRYLKQLFAAKGIYSNWDRLGNISAATNHLQHIKKQVARSMRAAYQGTTHEVPDMSALVWRIADKSEEHRLQDYIDHREGQPLSKGVPDLRALGREKFASASLATFNKKMRDFIAGKPNSSPEIDELPPPDFAGFRDDEEEDYIEGAEEDELVL